MNKMKILNNDLIVDWLIQENLSETGQIIRDGVRANFSVSVIQLQVHINHGCGCKITQDRGGNWLFPCKAHKEKANEFRDGEIIHRNL
jgi:hypothetical protein